MFSRSEILAASICAVWAGVFLAPEGAAVLLAPLLGASVLLVRRYPRAGSLGVAALILATFAAGVPKDNPATLAIALTASYSLGRHGASARDLPFVALFILASVVVGGIEVADLVFLGVVFGAAWAVGRVVASRAAKSHDAAEAAEELAGRDPSELAARVVAAERSRIAADALGTIRAAVTQMRASARRSEGAIDEAALVEVQTRGRAAVAELRHLLGLLRSDSAVAEAQPAGPSPDDKFWNRGPNWLVDSALGAVLAGLALIDLQLAGLLNDPASVALTIGVALAAALARRQLLFALSATAALVAASILLDQPLAYGFSTLLVCGLLAWFTVIDGDLATWLIGATAAALLLIAIRTSNPGNEAILVAMIAIPALAAQAWQRHFFTGDAAERRAAQLEAQHQRVAAAALRKERVRMARELHDVASHAVGVMVIQAGAALALRHQDPAAAAEAVQAVLAAGDEAENDLARLAALLEEGEPAFEDSVTLVPGPGHEAALNALVGRMRGAGIDIALDASSLPADPAVFATVYRVVQESLTNAARHAPGSSVSVVIAADENWVDVRILDDGATEDRDGGHAGTGGFGLVGLAERVQVAGGSSSAGPAAGGGFEVKARIPSAAAGLVTA